MDVEKQSTILGRKAAWLGYLIVACVQAFEDSVFLVFASSNQQSTKYKNDTSAPDYLLQKPKSFVTSHISIFSAIPLAALGPLPRLTTFWSKHYPV